MSPAQLLAELSDRLEASAVAYAAANDPCYACECCARWAGALEVLRDSIRRHVAGELRLAPCHPHCLVCAEVDWHGGPGG